MSKQLIDEKKFTAMSRPRKDRPDCWVHNEDVEHRTGLGWKVNKKSKLYKENVADEIPA